MAKTELVQTRGSVRIEGVIVGFDPNDEKTYREGVSKDSGNEWRSINLAIKTSENNIVYLERFGSIPTKPVSIFSNANGENKTLKINFEDRDFVDGRYHGLPEGFTPIGFHATGLGLISENGKIKVRNYFNYDAIEIMKDSLYDGASVWVDAEFNINEYERDGEKKTTVKYDIRRIGFMKNEINFENEDFKEVSSFEQEFVVVNVQSDKESKKLYVTGRIISFDQSWKDMQFIVDGNVLPVLAGNIAKKFKFGDLVTVQGKIINGSVLVEAPVENEFDWGGEVPEGQNRMVKRGISEIQITNVKKFEPKKYKEDAFIVDDFDFGGESFDVEEDALPF